MAISAETANSGRDESKDLATSHISVTEKNERMAALLNIFRQNVSRLVLTFCRGRDSGDGGGELIKLGL